MKDPRVAKIVVFINALVPLALLAWDAWRGRLGANPVEFALHTTGMLALVFLLLTLTVTPARKISGWNWLSHFRRMLGLFAFFYACMHFSIYFTFDRSLSLIGVVRDTGKRPFILLGMTGLMMMVPLAITSTNKMVKRMGALWWKRLHRLVYPAAIAGVIHYCLVGKVLTSLPVALAGVLTVLLGYRLVADYVPSGHRRAPARPGAASPRAAS